MIEGKGEFLHKNPKPHGILLSPVWLSTLQLRPRSSSGAGTSWTAFHSLWPGGADSASVSFCFNSRCSVGGSAGLGSGPSLGCACEEKHGVAAASWSPYNPLLHCCNQPVVVLNSHTQCPHKLAPAIWSVLHMLNTPSPLLHSQPPYFWFAFSGVEWICWFPFSFSVTDCVRRWL